MKIDLYKYVMPTTIHVNDEQGIVFFLEPNMKLGVEVIDHVHEKLFKIINKLNIDLHEGPYDSERALSVLNDLLRYGADHFKHEERLFKITGYPTLETDLHISSHQFFIREIDNFVKELPDHLKMIDVLKFLCDWLNKHTYTADKMFVDFYKTHVNSDITTLNLL